MSASLTVLGSGIDTLSIGFYGDPDAGIMDYLATRKAIARGLDEETGELKPSSFDEAIAEVAGWTVMLKPHGYKHYPYVFHNDDIRGRIAESSSRNLAPNIYVTFNSDFLWRASALAAYQQGQAWAFRLCNDELERELVSEVHIAVDVQGWAPPPQSIDRFLTRAIRRDEYVVEHSSRNRFSGYTFGKGPFLARLYDKTLEMTVHRKPYFSVLWENQAGYDSSQPVWRIEFQLRRETLKEFAIDTPRELFARLNALWVYCTTQWLRFVEPSADSRRRRWPTHPAWREIARTRINDGSTPALRDASTQARIEQMISMLLGGLTSYAALKGRHELDHLMPQFYADLKARLARDDQNFAQLVRKKAARFSHIGD